MTIRQLYEYRRQQKLGYDRNRKFKEGYRERDAARKRKEYWGHKAELQNEAGKN